MTTHSTPARSPVTTMAWAAALTVLFLATRYVNYLLWQLEAVKFVENDVGYYGWGFWCLLDGGLSGGDGGCVAAAQSFGILGEYPMPAVWLLQGLYTLGGGFETWSTTFVVAMVFIDAVVAILLFRRGNPWGSLFWIAFIGACGPIAWFRFDLVTAALVALACLCVARHPAVAGGLIGLGAGIKLWPALLAIPLASPNPIRSAPARRRTLGFLVVGVGLGVASLLAVGWTRSASALEWQSLRGLQQESVPATPLVFLRAFVENPTWELKLSEYKAIELFGPGVDLLLQVSTVLTVAAVLLTAVLAWRLLRTFTSDSPAWVEAVILSVFAVLLAMIVANKVLSTQYVQWLAGPVAALLVLRTSEWLRRPLRVLAAGLLAVSALTQYTYPWGTFGIMGLPNAVGYDAATLILRNVLLVALLAYTVALAWRATRRTRPNHDGVVGSAAPTGATAV